ncbi:hypothetical protein ACFWWA_24470 [Streptomyces goshikiensis]|uniref:hypothetical protein n=1 Tax=Streptomyces goshikiensis TaxID=1942 RepID=UPI00366554B1
MSTVVVSRRTLVRAAAVTACAGSLLALPAAAALAEGLPAAAASGAPGVAASQRVLLKSLSLADGVSTAHVYRVAKNAYQADILRDGATVATLTSRDGVPARGEAGELHAALQPDGRLSSWVGETRPAADGSHRIGGGGHKTGVRDGQVVAASVRATVRASVGASEPGAGAGSGPGADGKGGAIAAGRAGASEALRLDSLADGPGDGLLLLAAGGGIAAVGAAGLGFAMLRRGRTNG